MENQNLKDLGINTETLTLKEAKMLEYLTVLLKKTILFREEIEVIIKELINNNK